MFQLEKFNESDFGDLTKSDNLLIESHSSPCFQFYYVQSSLKNEKDFHKIFSSYYFQSEIETLQIRTQEFQESINDMDIHIAELQRYQSYIT